MIRDPYIKQTNNANIKPIINSGEWSTKTQMALKQYTQESLFGRKILQDYDRSLFGEVSQPI